MTDPRDLEEWRRVRRRHLTIAGNAVGLTVTAGLTSRAVTFPRTEADASYGVVITPSWLTTIAVGSKTTSGFTVTFGTAAPANATLDYITLRSEG